MKIRKVREILKKCFHLQETKGTGQLKALCNSGDDPFIIMDIIGTTSKCEGALSGTTSMLTSLL
jgi:hypothetical protein